MTKTNVMRLLDAAKINYEFTEYEFDEEFSSGIIAAEKINMPPEQVFKTLVTRGDKTGINVFVIPVAESLDLKKAAKISKNKSIEMILVKELLGLTGYVRGGCSPIGMKKKFPTFIDETAELFDVIAINAGVRGGQLLINPIDLVNYINSGFFELTI